MLKRAGQMFILLLVIGMSLMVPTYAEAKAPKGSQIAQLPVDGKTNVQIIQQLETEIAIWYAGEDFELVGEFEYFTLPRSVVKFDIDATLRAFQEQTKRTLSSFFMKKRNVQLPLVVTIDEDNMAVKEFRSRDYIDTDIIFDRIEEIASELGTDSIPISYVDEENIPFETVAEVELEIPKLSNAVLHFAVKELDDVIIEKKSTFSFIHAVDFPKAIGATSKEMSFLGTALYQLFLHSTFDIIERHQHVTVPNYAKAGLDAEVNVDQKKNLIVYNNDVISYKLDVNIEGDYVVASLLASPRERQTQYEQKEAEEIEQRTIYRYSRWVEPGDVQVVQDGEKGVTIETRRNYYDNNNMFLKSEVISKDVYLPIPRILLVSHEDPVEEEIDIEIEEEIDIESVEEQLNNVDNQLNNIADSVGFDWDDFDTNDINIIPTDQLAELKHEQARLEEMIVELEEMFLILEEALRDDLAEQRKLLEDYYDEMLEKYDQFLESLLQDTGENGIEDEEEVEEDA